MGNQAMKTEVQEELTLRWPDGWDRTRVGAWQKRAQWKHSREQYKSGLVKELERMGAASILITRAVNERDPGVAVWFSMTRDSQEWQEALGFDHPFPLLEDIDEAFKERAKMCHPDRGGDIAAYQRLVAARTAAKDWVLGKHQQRHDFVMALDLFAEARWNMAGLKLALFSLRRLKMLGMPSILERTLNKAFKAALPMQANGGQAA